jgi:hypothetical protein
MGGDFGYGQFGPKWAGMHKGRVGQAGGQDGTGFLLRAQTVMAFYGCTARGTVVKIRILNVTEGLGRGSVR